MSLNIKNYTIVDVPADGSCFFHAVILGMHYSKYGCFPSNEDLNTFSQLLRQKVVDRIVRRMKRNPSNMQFLMGSEFKNLQHYEKMMRKSCTWAGQLEVLTTSNIIGGISIYHNMVPHKLTKIKEMSSNENKNTKTIKLLLQDVNVMGTHYQLIIPKTHDKTIPYCTGYTLQFIDNVSILQ